MKRLLGALNRYRVTDASRLPAGWQGDETCGAFVLPSPIDDKPLRVIASSDLGWDHVSVSREERCPTWEEMEFIRHRFFQAHEVVLQFHVPATEHINCHPYCLHLWRPQHVELPRPPGWMVGPTT